MTDVKKRYCRGCDEEVEETFDDYGYDLCKNCNDNYDNSSGHCSLSCCVGNGCDGSC